MGEEEALAWENVRSSMSELEGGESVERAEEEDRIRIITLRKPVLVLGREDPTVNVNLTSQEANLSLEKESELLVGDVMSAWWEEVMVMKNVEIRMDEEVNAGMSLGM